MARRLRRNIANPWGGIPRLSTSFHKFGNVFLTPLTWPAQAGKSAGCGHPLPRGERVRRCDSHPSIAPQPSSLAGESARGTRAGEGARRQRRKRSHALASIRKGVLSDSRRKTLETQSGKQLHLAKTAGEENDDDKRNSEPARDPGRGRRFVYDAALASGGRKTRP